MNLRVKQAAHHLGLSKSTLDKLRCFGGGPRYYKLGRAVVYEVTDLDAWKGAADHKGYPGVGKYCR